MSPQFVDFNGDGHLDIVAGIFDGSPHVAFGGAAGFAQPQQILDREGQRIVMNQFWNFETKKWDSTSRCDPEDAAGALPGPDSAHTELHLTSAWAFDWDADGDLDLLLGDHKVGYVMLRRNQGSLQKPLFATRNEFVRRGKAAMVVPGTVATLRTVDFDEDGKEDLLVSSMGDAYGQGVGGGVYLYPNRGEDGAPDFAEPIVLVAPFAATDDQPWRPHGGLYADAFDWDRDGDLDLVVGGYANWTPPSRELTDAEQARVAVIQGQLREQQAKSSAVREKIRKALEGVAEEELEEKRADLFAAHRDELNGPSVMMRELRKELAELVPSPQRESHVWWFENTTRSVFDPKKWQNIAVGIGGGAGGKYSARRSSSRSAEVAEAIASALRWLEQHQDEDGRWDCDGFFKHDSAGKPGDGGGAAVHDVGATALALLAFLGDGSSMRSGPYKKSVQRGVLWLREQQQENGFIGSNASSSAIYDHAIATYAMVEAFGLSKYKRLKTNAQRSIDYLEYHRNPNALWRYQPQDGDNDMSVSSWCLMAYASAESCALTVNRAAFKAAEDWIAAATDETGRTGYSRQGERSARLAAAHMQRFPPEHGEAMTGAALMCRYFLGQLPEQNPAMDKGAELLVQSLPVWDEATGAIDFYYWYWATYAMYQTGGARWQKWNKALLQAALDSQRKDSWMAGSWDPVGVWGETGGRVYATAMMALSLEASYRYQRLVR